LKFLRLQEKLKHRKPRPKRLRGKRENLQITENRFRRVADLEQREGGRERSLYRLLFSAKSSGVQGPAEVPETKEGEKGGVGFRSGGTKDPLEGAVRIMKRGIPSGRGVSNGEGRTHGPSGSQRERGGGRVQKREERLAEKVWVEKKRLGSYLDKASA